MRRTAEGCGFCVCRVCCFCWLLVPRFFANHCMTSSHTRESVTDKASCSIGYGAKKNQCCVQTLCACSISKRRITVSKLLPRHTTRQVDNHTCPNEDIRDCHPRPEKRRSAVSACFDCISLSLFNFLNYTCVGIY